LKFNNVIDQNYCQSASDIDNLFWLSSLDTLVYLLPKTFNIFGFPISTSSVPDGYSRNVSCVLNWIPMILLDTEKAQIFI